MSSGPANVAFSPASSPLLDLPGAVAGVGLDSGVAWHYGDPVGEQRAATRRAALVDLSNRGLIAVSGPDRLTFLHTLTTQHFLDLADGSATWALILSPQGHVEHHMGVTDLDGTVYLDTEPATAASLLQYLTAMVFWSKVEVYRADHFVQLRLIGPESADIAAAAGSPPLPAPGRVAVRAEGGFLRADADEVDLFVPRADLLGAAEKLIAAGARPAGSWAAEALRIAARRPRLGVDTDERTIPNELPWLAQAVHLEKGCYRGQETVARVNNLGRPPRRQVLLHLDGSADRLPETGDAVLTAQGRSVGRVGSVGQHHELGPVALALVKRSVPTAEPLLAGGVDAAIDPEDQPDEVLTPISVVDRRAFTDIRRR